MNQKIFTALGLIAFSAAANATVLTFDIAGLTDGQLMPQAYGDNVTATSMGSFSYGMGSGFTPNVTVDYLGKGVQQDLNFWSTGYNDLQNVLEYEPDGDPGYFVTLTGSNGHGVNLESFDLGNFGGEITLPGITVRDENNNVLWSQSNIFMPNSGVQSHLHFDLGLSAQAITIDVDTTGLGGNSDNVGLDNISFSETAVPEPATIAALGIGAIGLLRRRRR